MATDTSSLLIDFRCTRHRGQRRPKPPPACSLCQFGCELGFSTVSPKYPGRAIFSVHAEDTRPVPWLHTAFKSLQDRAWPGRLGAADSSVSSGRLRQTQNNIGLFIIQVRGGLHHAEIPGLSIDRNKYEVSFEWKKLFTRVFEDRKAAVNFLETASVSRQRVW